MLSCSVLDSFHDITLPLPPLLLLLLTTTSIQCNLNCPVYISLVCHLLIDFVSPIQIEGCHSFHEKGFEFDTGIHYIGEMRNNTAFRFLLDQLSNGHLGWCDVCDDFDTVVLVDEGASAEAGLDEVNEAVNGGTALKARWVSTLY